MKKIYIHQPNGRELLFELNNNFFTKDEQGFTIGDDRKRLKYGEFVKCVFVENEFSFDSLTKINHIKHVSEAKASIIETGETLSSVYLTPFLKLNPSVVLNETNRLFFTNTYINDTLDGLYVVYKWNNLSAYEELEQELCSNKYYVNTIKGNRFTAYLYKSEYLKDIIKLFFTGNLKQMSNRDKHSILDFWYHNYPENYKFSSVTSKILFDDPEYRIAFCEDLKIKLSELPEDITCIQKPIKDRELWSKSNFITTVFGKS